MTRGAALSAHPCSASRGGRRLRAAVIAQQRGFALISGVFLITILFLLSAYLIGFRVQQDSSIALDANGSRAFAAAVSGAEWAAFNSLRNGMCAASTTLAFATAGLNDFTATVTCSRATYDEAGAVVTMDTIVATACNQPQGGECPSTAPGSGYVERQVTMKVGL
jgi:MSHA biogenesis protein MshP